MAESLAEAYARSLHDHLGQYAACPPGHIRLGDYGVLRGGLFERLGNVADEFSIAIVERVAGQPISWDFKSEDIQETSASAQAAVGGTALAAPGVPTVAKSKVVISFAQANSVYFKSLDCIYHGVENQTHLAKSIMELFRNGSWQSDYVVVTRLFKSGHTTAIMSSGTAASIELEADLATPDALDLIDAGVGLKVTSQKNIGLRIIAEPGLIALFGISKVRLKHWWDWLFMGPSFNPVLLTDPSSTPPAVLPGQLIRDLPPTLSPEAIARSGLPLEEVLEFGEIP